MSRNEAAVERPQEHRLSSLLRQVLAMLGAEFLLGTGAGLIGLPGEVDGAARVATLVLIGLHVLLAIGIVVVAILLWVNARRGQLAVRAALIGLIAVVVTFLAGVGTLATGSGWLSFIMAAGFLVAAGCYVAGYTAVVRSSSAR